MWRKAFVATAVALGENVDDALATISDEALDTASTELVQNLRAPQRATRAAALAKAVRDVVVALDECALR